MRREGTSRLIKILKFSKGSTASRVDWSIGQHKQYEVIQRRYFKWTLGLPSSTRDANVTLETRGQAVGNRAIGRAVKYECRMDGRSSELLKAAFESMKSEPGYVWKRKRKELLNRLGWSEEVADQQVREHATFWQVIQQRACDIDIQLARQSVDKLAWYIQSKDLPQCLKRGGRLIKTNARFRCGADCGGTGKASWRDERSCRNDRTYDQLEVEEIAR